MERIQWFVEGTPIPQPRQRISMIGGHARAYMPKNHPVQAWKQAITIRCREAMKAARMRHPFTGPVEVSIDFILPRPKCKTRKRGENGREWHDKRGDADNYAKSVLDSLTGFVFVDDGQVSALTVCKFVASAIETPGAKIVVTKLDVDSLPVEKGEVK